MPLSQREPRKPSHSFQLKVKPWQLQPFLLAPVLPGETMKNLLIQSRIVTDPIKHPLVGWWCEYYFFYVKHRDMSCRDELTKMMIDPSWVMPPALVSAKFEKYYHVAGHINWCDWCMDRVVTEYFRMEGEQVYSSYVIDAVPVASVNPLGVIDSLRLQSEYDALDRPVEGSDADTVIDQSEIEIALARWQMLRFNNLTDMTYEEYLNSYGVHTAAAELHVPELLRYVREWQYPTSHVEASTGVPSSAVSWKVAERADKDRYFSEPGFIFGIQCVRPKIYMGNAKGSFADLMETSIAWLPSVLNKDAAHSLIQTAPGANSPLSTVSTAYSWDVRDLLLYGDQFTNFDTLALGDNAAVNLPSATGEKRYASSADADGLFKNVASNLIRSDGRVDITILGRQIDYSGTS